MMPSSVPEIRHPPSREGGLPLPETAGHGGRSPARDRTGGGSLRRVEIRCVFRCSCEGATSAFAVRDSQQALQHPPGWCASCLQRQQVGVGAEARWVMNERVVKFVENTLFPQKSPRHMWETVSLITVALVVCRRIFADARRRMVASCAPPTRFVSPATHGRVSRRQDRRFLSPEPRGGSS